MRSIYQAEYQGNAFKPSDKQAEMSAHVFERHWQMSQQRDKEHRYFNDRTLIDYIDDSTKRWNGYVPPRDDLQFDWQSRVFLNFTRNVTTAFLSKAAMQRPKVAFTAVDKQGTDDIKRSQILDRLYNWSKNNEKGDWKFFQAGLELTTKGTVAVYEGYKKTKRKIREVERYNLLTGEFKAKEKEIISDSDCFNMVIPIEDMFFANIWQSDVQLQDDVIWARRMTYGEAAKEFNKFPNWKYVKPGGFWENIEQTPFYKTSQYSDIEEDQVYVIRYFCKETDTLHISAGGIPLYDGPIPFHHKDYPFGIGIYEPFGTDFIYGKSLPDKIAHDQDVMNTIINMMLDQNFLSIHKPILTQDEDDDEDTIVLVPGLVRKVNSIDNYRVLNELSGPENSVMNLLQFFMKQAHDDSGAIMGGGPLVTPEGGKVTARQALLQEETSRQILGLNARMLEKLESDLAPLRAANLLQFQMLPDNLEEITGDREDAQLFYKSFRLDDTELSDGTYGTSIIRVYPDEESFPNQLDLDVESEIADLQGKNLEIKAITPDYIRNMEYDVQVIPNSTFSRYKSTEQALSLELLQTLFPFIQMGQVDGEELLREVVLSFDKDPKKLIKKQEPQPAMAGMGAQGVPQVASQINQTNKPLSLKGLTSA